MLDVCIREERSKIKHASFHLRVLEKEQIKSKVKEENNKAKVSKIKNNKQKPQIANRRNKREGITTDPIDVKSIIKKYFEQFCPYNLIG